MVNYTDYKIMANNISYWIIKNDKKIKTRKEYTFANKEKKSLAEIKKILLKSKDTDNKWGRKFLECAVIDNADTSSFPNYVTYKNRQYNKSEYIYMAKYVIAWWKSGKHDKAPTTVPLKADDKKKSTSKVLNPYMTNTGCSGMGQCTGYNCACNSLQQSFYRLTGIKVPESTIAKWAGTTSAGTSHQGIETAVAMFNKTYKKNVKISWKSFNDLGKNDNERWQKVAELIKKGALFFHLLYRNKWGHYEIIYSVGDMLKILNSLGNSCGSGTYCGYIEYRTRAEQKSYINGISQKSIAFLYNGD